MAVLVVLSSARTVVLRVRTLLPDLLRAYASAALAAGLID